MQYFLVVVRKKVGIIKNALDMNRMASKIITCGI